MAEHVEKATVSLEDRLAQVHAPAERAVAEHLVREGPRVAAMSAREIANAVGTSDATVVRTAKSLGYANLRELRQALADRTEDADLVGRLRATLDGTPTPHDVLARAADTQVNALGALLLRVSPAQFDEATALLATARRVWWSGIGPSAYLAGYGAFLCRRLGKSSGSLTHAGTDHADELLDLEAGDAVVVLAYGRIHPAVSVLLARTADVDARTVLITDTPRPRLAHPATVVLDAGRGTPELFATHGPTIVLLEAIVLAIAASEPARSATALTTLNELRRSIAGKRLDVDPA